MRGPVDTGDPGAVEHEGDRQPMQRHVHQHLIECPVEERGIHRDHGMQAGHGQPGGRGDRVLLGDTDVENSLRERAGEVRRPVGRSIAAVTATTRASRWASGRVRRPNTWVQPGFGVVPDRTAGGTV